MIEFLNKRWPLIQAFILIYTGFVVGKHIGFRDGVDLIEYDRNLAQQKINQCLRIIGDVK